MKTYIYHIKAHRNIQKHVEPLINHIETYKQRQTYRSHTKTYKTSRNINKPYKTNKNIEKLIKNNTSIQKHIET